MPKITAHVTKEIKSLKKETDTFSLRGSLYNTGQEIEKKSDKPLSKSVPIPIHVKLKIKDKLRKFNDIAMNRDTVIRGHVQFLNFEILKFHLGENWDKFRISIYEKVDEALNQTLSEKDVFLRTSESFYLVAFDKSNLQHAKTKLTLVCDEIIKFYLGNKVRRGAAMIDEIMVTSSEQEADAASFLKDINLMSNFYEEDDDKKEVSSDQAPIPHDNKTNFVTQSKLVYKPFWDAKNEVLIGYHSYLKDVSSLDCRYPEILSDTPECLNRRMEMDLNNLNELIDLATKLMENKFIFMSICPISFHTVKNREAFSEFINICKSQPKEIQKVLNIEFVEHIAGTPIIRLKEAVQLLSPYIRNVVLNTSLEDSHYYGSFKKAGIRVVSINLTKQQEGQNIETYSQIIGFLCEKAKKAGLSIMLTDVSQLEIAMIARAKGVRFISGPLIGKAVEFPQHMTKLKWDELKKSVKA